MMISFIEIEKYLVTVLLRSVLKSKHLSYSQVSAIISRSAQTNEVRSQALLTQCTNSRPRGHLPWKVGVWPGSDQPPSP